MSERTAIRIIGTTLVLGVVFVIFGWASILALVGELPQ